MKRSAFTFGVLTLASAAAAGAIGSWFPLPRLELVAAGFVLGVLWWFVLGFRAWRRVRRTFR